LRGVDSDKNTRVRIGNVRQLSFTQFAEYAHFKQRKVGACTCV